MAKSPNQKLKLLYIKDYLEHNTDPDHPATISDIIDELARHDITAERKSIYSDLHYLEDYGVDINMTHSGPSAGYYIAARDFELPELQLLVDSIQSSKFLTLKRTKELIGKLQNLTNVHDAKKLQTQLYFRNRVKSMNESVYLSLDTVSAAITSRHAIRFKYYEITVSKQRRFRHNGAWYTVSPFALLMDDENYYLFCYDHNAGITKHFRVDKMDSIEILDTPLQRQDLFRETDMSAYTKKVFGMFSGEPRQVQFRFKEHLAGAVVDRFGTDLMLIPGNDGTFTTTVEVVVSQHFLGWVFSFGSDAEILFPPDIRSLMKDRLAESAALYCD